VLSRGAIAEDSGSTVAATGTDGWRYGGGGEFSGSNSGLCAPSDVRSFALAMIVLDAKLVCSLQLSEQAKQDKVDE
jgi:hypothetical protein